MGHLFPNMVLFSPLCLSGRIAVEQSDCTVWSNTGFSLMKIPQKSFDFECTFVNCESRAYAKFDRHGALLERVARPTTTTRRTGDTVIEI